MKRKMIIAAVSVVMAMMLTGFFMGTHRIYGDIGTMETGNGEDTVTGSYEETGTRYTGTWHLSYDNDYDKMEGIFPDVYAFGDELVIRPDGRIYWHIGAAGAAGTYEAYGNQMSACVSDIMEYDEYRTALTVNEEGRLYMKYKSVPLEWVYSSEGY